MKDFIQSTVLVVIVLGIIVLLGNEESRKIDFNDTEAFANLTPQALPNNLTINWDNLHLNISYQPCYPTECGRHDWNWTNCTHTYLVACYKENW